MKLKLLDIEDFIKTRKVKQITSTKIYTGGGKNTFDQNGLFSEDIFGRIGSRQRKVTFGYVDLKCKVIHPEAYPILTSLNPSLTKLIIGKNKYVIENGELIQSSEGDSGILFLIKNFDKINLESLVDKYKQKHLEFIKENKNLIFIDKYLIIPAGTRDIQLSQKSGQLRMQHSELSTLYERLLRQTHSIIGGFELPTDIIAPITNEIQKTLKNINTWIKELLKGKQGIIRGGLLRKVTDYSARMIITPDPKLKLGYVGIPWQICLKLYEPFTIHEILHKSNEKEKISKFLGVDDLDPEIIKRFISNVNNDPFSIDGPLKEYLIKITENITKDKVLIYKRDPSENRNSWQSSYMRIDDTGYTMKLNPFDLCKNGGDFDGDAVSIFAILTEESQEQAKKEMNPRHAKSAWQPCDSAGRVSYEITLDASAAIYGATKE